ncbi:MAG: hypothetical protein IJA12_02035 [Oscillospiraceae bacterium]|nr:hypothetical protein [Oscillospiraceae bacterium]
MKKKSLKILSTLTSAVLTSALVCSSYVNINNDDSQKPAYVVCAEASEADKWEVDVYYIVVDEFNEYGEQCQWYTTSDVSFRTNGFTIKLNGKDVTDECYFSFEKGVTPAEVYDGINHDYEVPVQIISSNNDVVDATIPVRIGLEGDVNLDHIVDVRDASSMVRDIEYFEKHSVSLLDDFGLYLAAPDNQTKAYPLTFSKPDTMADKFAREALDRASGQKVEQKTESPYSLSISKAYGLPGETVTVHVIAEADDSFESLDAVIEWDDDTLKSAAAVAVNGTHCKSYAEDGMLSIVNYSAGNVGDGAIASIDFVIPENAQPGTNLEVYFSDVETFAVYANGSTSDVSSVSNIMGASISVMQPSETKPAVTTTQQTSQPTVSTTLSNITAKPLERGDANLDGSVDIRDAAYIAKKLAFSESTMLPDISDYNYDGRKDIRDAAAIAIYLATRFE